MSKFLQDSEGSSLIEFTLVFPVLLLAALGTVDITFMLFDWSMANKAAFTGARMAVVSNPVASGITTVSYTATQIANLGNWCFDTGTGSTNGNCPSLTSVCTPNASSGGLCITSSYTFDDTAFGPILAKMQAVFPRLQRQNVQISYNANGLGFVGQPNGLPMDVTVSVTGMTHQFFFIGPLMRFFGGNFPNAGNIPTFATTLTSEDMITN